MQRNLVCAAFALPTLLSAQAPVRYRYVAKSTTFMEKAAFDHSIETMKGAGIDVTAAAATGGALTQTVTSTVTLTMRDSAGGRVYQINVDSNLVDRGAYLKADQAARAILAPGQVSPPVTRAPQVILVFVKNGQPTSLTTNGRVAPNGIDAKHAWSSLQSQLPGLIYLIPSVEMPEKINGIYQDTFYVSRTTPASEATMMGTDGTSRGAIPIPGATTYDTTVAVWHRATSDTVHSAIDKRLTRNADNGGSTIAISSGVYTLVFDPAKALRDMTGINTTITTTLTAANGNIPLPRKAEQEYTLHRMP